MFESGSLPDVRVALFGGRGEVAVQDLLQDEQVPPFDAVLGCELSPGGSVGPHVQDLADELVVVLAGAGWATVSGRTRPLSPGVVVGVPLGETLALEASPGEPLRYLIVKARR